MNVKLNIESILILIMVVLNVQSYSQLKWLERDSEHFRLIYLSENEYLADHILNSAENALEPLSKLFNYTPTERIIINIYDINDYGLGSATTVPQNIIRLSIEPFEAGYENMLYTERHYWLLTHELVHIVINDQSTDFESITRKLFSKVPPEQGQPSSIIFSLLTNFGRYTPRWHQEGIAVYLETWLNGGFGRSFSNFDEMYFRTLVLDDEEFPRNINLETIYTHNSFLLGTLHYFLGTRFISYLSIQFGPEKVFSWYTSEPGDFYKGTSEKFEEVFGESFDVAWLNFIDSEKVFQNQNIRKLNKYKLTPSRHLTRESFGWVTQPNLEKNQNHIIFGSHRSHKLANLEKIDIRSGIVEEIGTLPTPSMYQVSSTAYDKTNNFLFYTTNNNQLYRDIWVLDVEEKKQKILFENYRVGYLTISENTHELWGIEHSNGFASLVFSPFPYADIYPVVKFNSGQEVNQLSVSPSGKYLAAVLHQTDGTQSLIVVNSDKLRQSGKCSYDVISNEGSPENPSWSPDNNTLFWNASTNGVSNIYRKDFSTGDITAMSHTLRGFFKPVYLSPDSLFVFEYSSEGFIPAIIPNTPAEYLPAIEYYGMRVIEKNPELAGFNISGNSTNSEENNLGETVKYNALANIDINSVIPTISGFQSQKVIGLYSHLSDPMFIHDFQIEVGVSPFNKNSVAPKFHLRAKYDYNRKIHLSFDQNATDFYDLFNDRKRGMIGRKITLGYSHYWKYDNPHKIKQSTEVTLYNGVQFINDNLVKVSRPDFMVAQTQWNSTNLRRTIGSSDYENGNVFDVTLRVFGDNPDAPEYAGQVTAEWDNYSKWLADHNTFHFQLAGGYHYDNPDLIQARFYFGGFGNRYVENVDVKQYRKLFRFPGLPIYSLAADRFVKVIFENNLPPLRFANAAIGSHLINHVDASIYSQALFMNSDQGDKWIDLGAQVNFVMKHWFNLETTFSTGIAKAWGKNSSDWEWFMSLKLLKN
jgi:hypothetical protein